MTENAELMYVEELFENDDVILLKSTFRFYGDIDVLNIDVGVKDKSGDIVRMITVDSKRLNCDQ